MRVHPFYLVLVFGTVLTAAVQPICTECKCEINDSNTTLKILRCKQSLTITNSSFLDVPKTLAVIAFKNVQVNSIDENAFEGFDLLESIVIEDSQIKSIDPKTFLLPELGTLNFVRTIFEESPQLSSEYLEELIFNECQLSEVPNLDKLPALTFLNLANNSIDKIDESAFSKVINLEEVQLSNNKITKLHPKLFINNPELSVLTLDYNPLTSFQLDSPKDEDSSSLGLELLSLRHCELTEFDRRATDNLNLLNTLYLSGNKISVLNIDIFEPMTDLNTIDLSYNKLVELDNDIFAENSNLEKIVLDNNNFENLPKFSTKNKYFQTFTFSCKNCGLKSLKGAFHQMKNLEVVDLSNNQIETIEDVFNEMRGLKQVFLANNKISTIGINSFRNDSKLEELNLSQNPLKPLDPVVISCLGQLKRLNISSCLLKTLWANHNAVLPQLEQLSIDNNLLSSMTVKDLEIAANLKSVNVENNMFFCNDDLLDVVKYLKNHNIASKELKTHESLSMNAKRDWQSALNANCSSEEDEDEDDDDDSENYTDDYDTDDNESGEDVEAVLTSGNLNLAKASYILSITTVFILTALLVLFIAVVITLLILKRNKSFSMHNGNLPRLKIPLWHSTPGQKKHSGSIYRPLSEELGSSTTIVNWYDFKQIPQVHN